jgi:hypothetical protein
MGHNTHQKQNNQGALCPGLSQSGIQQTGKSTKGCYEPGTYRTYIIDHSRGILYRTVMSRTIIVPKINCLSFGKGRGNQDCCDTGYNTHNFYTNEGCTYQGQNNQGLHFTRIKINSRDVFFKDRFMLAPQKGCKMCFM